MKLMVVASDSCSSLGDAMRDLYSKSLLKKDFIILDGFVVGNANLREAVFMHKRAVKQDPTCIMTCVYRRPNGFSGIKPRSMDNIRISHLALNSTTLRILKHFRPMNPSKLKLPTILFASNPKIRIWSVEDPHVSICTEKVPMLYSDNFDYGTRDSLIQGVLEQEELLNYSLRVHVTKIGHMLLVSSFRAFEELSKCLAKRWFSPLVPERSLSTRRIRYRYDEMHGNYYDESAKFHSKVLGDENVIDAGSEIDQRCKMKNTVVGKHCVIRGNVTINDSFLMDNVTIGNGCIIDNCFLGSNVKLLPGVHLEPGVVLGPNTKLGPNVKVDRYKRLVCNPPEVVSQDLEPLMCGKDGRAFEVTVDDETEEQTGLRAYGFQDLKWGEHPPVVNSLPILSDSEDSVNVDMENLDLGFSSDEEREKEFETEVMDSLLNAYRDESRLGSVKLELNSSRHAYNVSWENVLRVIIKSLLHVVEKSEGKKNLTGDKLWQSVRKGLNHFQNLISEYVTEIKHQIIVLNLLESLVNEEERFLVLIQLIFYHLNQELEVIDDEVVIKWYNKGGHKTPKFSLIAEKIKKFVEWLEVAEEEEDESDEDEDEDD
ncbi:Translation initiation factor eIF-2B subunit epsilon [Armadillidium nasatum]|uniref:Translation initiation factor eIF-2B subunit epsilon n=1 Tax=Armadillidium nasatum TaxID=96803 RepID=A0A5N5TCQ6_9CRUS|nr:Translation initiation factor eIF-2B subunit epsilon [Armadillidium nasatum]